MLAKRPLAQAPFVRRDVAVSSTSANVRETRSASWGIAVEAPIEIALNGVPWLVDGRTTVNLYGQVEFGTRGGGEGRHRFRLGVRNLTDRNPPLSTADGYFGALYQPYARYWYANLRSTF